MTRRKGDTGTWSSHRRPTSRIRQAVRKKDSFIKHPRSPKSPCLRVPYPFILHLSSFLSVLHLKRAGGKLLQFVPQVRAMLFQASAGRRDSRRGPIEPGYESAKASGIPVAGGATVPRATDR